MERTLHGITYKIQSRYCVCSGGLYIIEVSKPGKPFTPATESMTAKRIASIFGDIMAIEKVIESVESIWSRKA